LYGLIQTDNELPQELLFEINAAWDHLARISVYRDQNCDERREIEKSFSHLKRSCLDVFKLLVKRASEQHHELLRIDTSVIDNGEFDKNLHQFWRQIQLAATSARQVEGIPHDGPVKSFDQWQEVGRMCLQLQNDFFLHERVPWARRRHEDLRLATKLQSWGLQSWGLQSWGLQSWGLQSWGLQSWGLQSWGQGSLLPTFVISVATRGWLPTVCAVLSSLVWILGCLLERFPGRNWWKGRKVRPLA